MALRRELGLRDLVLFNVAAVIGIRWLASAVHAGPDSIVVWIGANLFFFVPSALCVAALTRLYPREGGLYVWARQAFGDWHGFLAAWSYWMGVLIYFPGLLVAGVTMAAYMLGSEWEWLAANRTYALAASLGALWLLTLVNLVGVRLGKWVTNAGAAATYLAGGGLIVLGWLAWIREGSATALAPRWQWTWEQANFWPQLAFAYVGLELAAVMAGEIRDPEKTVPRAAWIGGFLITFLYVAGTMAIMVLIPAREISIVSGIAQAGAAGGRVMGLPAAGVLMAALLTAGVAGQLSTWMGAVARLPYVLGVDHFLPARFARLHPRWDTPWWSLLFQATVCTAFLLLMLAGETLRGGYQLLVDMAVITTLLPLLYVFASGWHLAPGTRWAAASGFLVTMAGIALSFAPPAGISSVALFELKLLGGTAAVLAGARWWYLRKACAS